jgi:hypothetical protein
MTYRPSPSPILGAVIDPATFRDWIAAQVEAHGGQEGAAEHTGLTQSHISQILASDDYKPGLDKLMQIAMAQRCQDLSALFLRIEAWQRGRADSSRGSAHLPLTLRAETGHSASTHKTDEVVDASASLRSLSTTERRQLFLFQQRIGMGLVLTAQRELQELARLDRARNTTRTRESDRKISSPRKEQPRRSKDGSRGR